MTTPIKTFFSKITDEYGGEYQQAFIAVRAFSETSQNTGYAENCEEDYKVETELEAITYKANYWYSEQTKADGKRSRPLIYDNNGIFTDVFEVDLDSPDIIQILNSAMEPIDKVLHVIKTDVIRRFK
tara:strand:+ start:292 stop:672 length:381 start_codon:yes stop_codon:yes gene_type:complete